MRTMHAGIRSRSRLERAAAGDKLSTLPRKRSVLSVVLAGSVVPRQAERMHVALRGAGEREAIRGRMSRVVEVQGFRGVRIDAHGAFGCHFDHARRLNGPFGPIAIELDRRR